MFSDWCENKPFAKPWNKSDTMQMRKFWEKKDGQFLNCHLQLSKIDMIYPSEWYPTWNAETDDNAMQVDYIRVYALE